MSANKVIARNTIFLYLRMLLNMGVNFYTSRIILDALGIEDFGIYNVVGSIVVAFSFLQGALSGATSSFFSFYIGNNDFGKLTSYFSNSLVLHIGLSIVLIILGETFGVYFIKEIIDIPIGRENSALWVFQISLFTTVLNILALPFTSLIISYEKMGLYAFLGVLKSVLILIVSFFLLVYSGDKLVLYSWLLFFISLILLIINVLYVVKKTDLSISFKVEKSVFKSIFHFFGWDLYGNFSVLMNTQGIIVILNNFYGIIINAAIGIANQVSVAFNVLVNSFMMAVKPQIIKSYAIKDFERLQYLIQQLTKFSYYLLLIFSIPVYLKMDFLMEIWLKEVPKYTSDIARIIVVTNMLNTIINPFNYVIHATRKVKRLSFISGTFYLLVLPLSYYVLTIKDSFLMPYFIHLIAIFFVLFNNIYTAKIYVEELNISTYFKKCISPMAICTFLAVSISLIIVNLFGDDFMNSVIVILLSCLSTLTIIVFVGINKKERRNVYNMLINRINKN